MKKVLAILTILGLVIAVGAFAKDAKDAGHSTAGAKSTTMTGEILDAGCYGRMARWAPSTPSARSSARRTACR